MGRTVGIVPRCVFPRKRRLARCPPRTPNRVCPDEGRSLLSRRWAYGRWRGLSAVAPLALSLWLSPPLQASRRLQDGLGGCLSRRLATGRGAAPGRSGAARSPDHHHGPGAACRPIVLAIRDGGSSMSARWAPRPPRPATAIPAPTASTPAQRAARRPGGTAHADGAARRKSDGAARSHRCPRPPCGAGALAGSDRSTGAKERGRDRRARAGPGPARSQKAAVSAAFWSGAAGTRTCLPGAASRYRGATRAGWRQRRATSAATTHRWPRGVGQQRALAARQHQP